MKTMKKYIFALIATMFLPLSMMAQNVAKIDDTEYATLAEAVAAATDGQTIDIIADVTELEDGSELSINKSLTITGAVDGSGNPLYTISGKSSATGTNDIFITGSGTVTLSNLKIKNFGNNAASDIGHAPIYVSTNFTGTVNLSNLYISDFNRGGIFLYGGEFNVTGCDIDCANSTSGAFTKGIEIKGTATGTIQDTDIYNMERSSTAYSSAGIEIYGGGEITVNNCTISSNVEDHTTTKDTYGIVIGKVGVHDPAGGTLNLQDCTIDTRQACLSVDGANYTATVDDCTFATYVVTWKETSSITLNSGSFAEDVYADAGTIYINGGEFSSFAPYEGTNGTIIINAGTFDNDEFIPYLSDDAVIVDIDGDGNYVIAEESVDNPAVASVTTGATTIQYASVELAFATVADGSTITLLTDATLSENIDCPLTAGALTMTFGDYTITKGDYSVSLATGVTVTTDKQTDIFTAAEEGKYVVESVVGAVYEYTVATAVARIGSVGYASLQDAIAAVPTDGTATTVTLLKDITLTDNVVVGGTYGATPKVTTAITNQNVTLNLNNHNITGEKTIYLAGGSLNITGSGVIESTSEDVAPVGVRYVKTSAYPNLDYTSKRTLTIGNNVLLRGAQYGLNIFGTNEGTTANDIEVNVNGQVQGMLFVLGNLKNDANNIVINVKGTVDASNATGSEIVKTGIALGGNATVNVQYGATVKGESGIEVRAGNLNVIGGTITGTSSDYSNTTNGSGMTTKGAAIAVAQHGTQLPIAVVISDGTLSGKKLIAVTDVNNDMTDVSVTAKQNFVVNTETVIPDGYGWINNGDGTYTLKKAVASVDGEAFETFADAVTAAGNEKIITLLADITDPYTLSEGQLLQVIKNGFEITVQGPTGTADDVYSEVVTIGGKDVTIYMLRTDIAPLVSATLRSDYTGSEQSVPLEITYGDLTLVKGTDYKLQVAGVDVDDVTSTNPGPVTFKVVGIGKFYGEKEVTWTIYKNINNAPIRVEVDPAIYTTADIDPKDYVHVYDGDTELENPADYTVEASTTIKDAKTYVNAVTVKGTETAEKYIGGEVTFSMDVQPLDIRDVTAAGNAQPWRAAGYTTAQIAELITLTTTGGVTLEKDVDYTITVADGTYKDVNTYEDVITITAKSSNYSGTLKLDFTILPEGVIDISKCVVTSKAVYTSQSQSPSYSTIEVVYKNGYNKVVLDNSQFKIQLNGMMSGYIDAKTYSNAMTLVGTTAEGTNGLRFYGTVNADYVILPRDLADTNYEDDEVEVVLEKHKDMIWDGTDLSDDIKIGDAIGENNLHLYVKVKNEGYRYALTNDETTGKYDYSYTVSPSPMIEPGEYTVTFTGRGNFTGTREVKINVLKDISAADINVPLQVIPNNTSLTPDMLKDIELKDGNKALELGVHYTIVIKDMAQTTTFDEITNNGMYKAIFFGKEPYYSNFTIKEMPVVFEYNHFNADVDEQYYNGNTSGYQIVEPVSIHVTSGKNLECTVGDMNMSAVPTDSYTITLPGEAKFTLGNNNTYTLKVVGIEDNAFTGAESAHYVDATALTDYVPATLTRDYDGPFNGLPKQTLVFLRGTDFTGENYIYKYGDGDTDFRCDVLKIYEDLSGEQTGYNQANGYKWGFLNPYEFKANTVTNTRQLNAVNAENKQQGYTICLPYALPVPNAVDAYTLMASKSDLLGFKPVDGNTLDALTPYVLIPSASGQLLSTTNATIVKTTDADLNATAVTSASADGNAYTMYGSMTYMDALIGAYIMQSGNVWKQIDHEGSYGNGACILPMRAYIVPGTQPAPVLYSIFGMPGSTEMDIFEHIDIDAEDGQLYDLQGRPVTTPTRGVYVRNGKKVVIK